MVFTTYTFLFWFLPLVLGIHYFLQATGLLGLRTLFLTIASYVFYGWQRPDFLLLILVSTVLDFICGRVVGNPTSRRRKAALITSIVCNLALLGYFKYFNFAMDTASFILESFGLERLRWTTVALPVGISFYTFQTMSYTIDIYRGEARPANSFGDMACYVALFPQLVAGPIVRYRDLDEQLRERSHTFGRFGHGVLIFMCGFAKKILLADSAGRLADAVFGQESPGALTAWAGVLGYTMQIYYDFSGYSDMAVGLGRMFGFEFPINFASPYRSRSITEFWRRWHITLSTWLRDYLYIPLGGNRKGPVRTYVNLALTMLLGGLWHGAQWTFVVWGALHGVALALERMTGKRAPWSFLPAPFEVAITLVIVMIGWTFFRATSFADAWHILQGLVGVHGARSGFERVTAIDASALWLTGISLVLTWAGIQSDHLVNTGGRLRRGFVTAFLFAVFSLAVAHMFFTDYSPFLYFQF